MAAAVKEEHGLVGLCWKVTRPLLRVGVPVGNESYLPAETMW